MDRPLIDLHAHGPIGFQPYWLKKQGYAGKNLLGLMAEQCFTRGITICAVTSHYRELTPANDRFRCLKEGEAPTLSREYSVDSIGNNILRVERDGHEVFFVNGQTVMTAENGNEYDHLVIGSNRVPTSRSIADTLSFGKDHGLIQIMEHPFAEAHRGLGQRLAEKYVAQYDAVEGFNAQAALPYWMDNIPFIGAGVFSHACAASNTRAQAFAKEHGKPYVATSDAHRIEDIGRSHIRYIGDFPITTESAFFEYLGTVIRTHRFFTYEHSQRKIDLLRWTPLFMWGCFCGVKEEYIPCSQVQ